MKRFVSVILSLVLIISVFAACTKAPAEQTKGTQAGTVEVPQEVPNIVNGVYASCENYDFTYYNNTSVNGFSFYLICEKPLPEDAAITINDIATTYKTAITQKTGHTLKMSTNMYWFMKEPDKDWAAHYAKKAQMYEEIKQLNLATYGTETPHAASTVVDQDAKKKLDAAWDAYQKFCTNPYQEEAFQYSPYDENLYYCYQVTVSILKLAEQREQIKSMELSAGDMSRTITLKNVWLEPFDKKALKQHEDFESVSKMDLPATTPQGTYSKSDYFSDYEKTAATSFPYSTGISGWRINLMPKEDIVLKNIYFYGESPRQRVEYAEIVIVDKDGKVVTSKWTPGTELLLRKGEYVAVMLYWSDSHFELLNYQMSGILNLDYELGGTDKTVNFSIHYHRSTEPAEIYLWAFKGLDIKNYYTGFYFPEHYGNNS